MILLLPKLQNSWRLTKHLMSEWQQLSIVRT